MYFAQKKYSDISALLDTLILSQTLCARENLIQSFLTRSVLDVRFQRAIIDHCEMIYEKDMVINVILTRK